MKQVSSFTLVSNRPDNRLILISRSKKSYEKWESLQTSYIYSVTRRRQKDNSRRRQTSRRKWSTIWITWLTKVMIAELNWKIGSLWWKQDCHQIDDDFASVAYVWSDASIHSKYWIDTSNAQSFWTCTRALATRIVCDYVCMNACLQYALAMFWMDLP